MIVKVNGKLIDELLENENNKIELVRGLKFALPASVITGSAIYSIDTLSHTEANTAYFKYNELSYMDKLVEVLETAMDLSI